MLRHAGVGVGGAMWLAHVVDGTHFRHECSLLDRWHMEKIWKNTTHFRHECDKRSEIQDEKRDDLL